MITDGDERKIIIYHDSIEFRPKQKQHERMTLNRAPGSEEGSLALKHWQLNSSYSIATDLFASSR